MSFSSAASWGAYLYVLLVIVSLPRSTRVFHALRREINASGLLGAAVTIIELTFV